MGELLDGRIKYDISDNGCWICTSHAPRKRGYYNLKCKGKTQLMHRVVFETYNERINADLVVRHTCDNALCINPNHLILGTQADNVADRVLRKGR